jgi:ribonuclease P protein component
MTKSMRLRRRQEFVEVQSSGTKVHGRNFLALVAPSRLPPGEVKDGDGASCGRLGITVTRKVGNAVTRNRIRRLVREWMRRHGWVPAGRDVVVIAKESANALEGYDDVDRDLARMMARVGGLGAAC